MNTMAAFLMGQKTKGNERMVFDWIKAATLIKNRKPKEAWAGLSDDWKWTGGLIFADGKPVKKTSAYLASTWATPKLDLDGKIIRCYKMQSQVPKWGAFTCWPKAALDIINAKHAKSTS